MTHYLDYAATSAVRPPEVVDAVVEFLGGCGASPGRGGHRLAVESGRMAFRCRRALQKLLGVTGDPGRVAFMQNATHALNTALWGLVDDGDVVVGSVYDHNAVLRPMHQLSESRSVEVRMLSGAPDGSVDLVEAERLFDGAKVVVLNAVSNVLGTILPMDALVSLAHDAGASVVVDAAQHTGHLPLGIGTCGADLIAFTGHKGLLGPQGTGGLWVREGLEVRPMLCGGTGGDSAIREMPSTMPDHLEAGTPNAPGLAGLLAGCDFLTARGVDSLHKEESRLKDNLREGLLATDGVRVLSPAAPEGVGIVTFVIDGTDPGEVSSTLDSEYGVLARSGLHCAPEVHRLLGTEKSGAVRLSLGWASTDEDVAQALAAVEQLTARTRVAVG